MSSTCGLCGKDDVFVGRDGVCCACCFLLNNCPISKTDICLMVRTLSPTILEAS